MLLLLLYTPSITAWCTFRGAFADPLRLAKLAIPEVDPEANGGIEQVIGSAANVAVMGFHEWILTEARMQMCHMGLIGTALTFANV